MTNKPRFNFGLILGIAGTIAGVFLIVQGSYFIGIAGGIASASLAYTSYKKMESK